MFIFRGVSWPDDLAARHQKLVGGFKYFFFSPLFGEDSHFDSYFSTGLVQPPTRKRRHQNSPRFFGFEVKRPRAHRALSRANTAPIDVPWPP